MLRLLVILSLYRLIVLRALEPRLTLDAGGMIYGLHACLRLAILTVNELRHLLLLSLAVFEGRPDSSIHIQRHRLFGVALPVSGNGRGSVLLPLAIGRNIITLLAVVIVASIYGLRIVVVQLRSLLT